MNLTVLTLNTSNAAVRRDLADVQQMHRTVQTAVATDRSDACVLWRFEPDTRRLFVQSTRPQSWAHLPNGYLTGQPEMTRPSPVSPGRYTLRATVNPTWSRSNGPGCRGTKLAIEDPAAREEWLRRKLAGAAELHSYRELWQARLVAKRGGDDARLLAVEVAAEVDVVDAGAFDELRRAGVGRGRAYGCGLLLTSA